MRLSVFLFIITFLSIVSCIQKNLEKESIFIIQSDTLHVLKEIDSLHKIKLVFIGDIMQHGDQIRSAFHSKSGLFDYEPCFRYISPILKSADWVIANLELTLNDKNEYSGYPRFRSPDALAYFLKDAGFNVLVTANNHSNDNWDYGLVHTLDVLDSLGIYHTGTFRDTSEWYNCNPLILDKKTEMGSFRFALLNYTYGTNGLPTRKPNVVNEIDTVQIKKDIEKARTSSPDIIIAYMHWGNEYQPIHNSHQEILANWLWNNGVEIVIGSHPHVIQPITEDTIYNSDSSSLKKVLCAYSLGNFISNQFRPSTDIGLILEIEILKNIKSGKIDILNHHYIHNYKKLPVQDWVHTFIPISAFESDSFNFLKMPERKISEMINLANKTRKHLNKYEGKERFLDFKEIVFAATLAPDSVKTNLPQVEKPFIAKVK